MSLAYRKGQKVRFVGPGKWIKNPPPSYIKRPTRNCVYTIREVREDPWNYGMLGLLLEEIVNPGNCELAWWAPEFFPLEPP